jgi:hypothetical protein
LEQGEYQFTGRLRTEGLQFDDTITRGGVTLRLSGDREPRMLAGAPEWTTFRYDFAVSGPADGLTDVELLCEMRASRGRVWFDANSLKLIRKGATPKR